MARPELTFAQVSEAWVARYNGPSNSTDYAQALTVDGAGNVYVTGYSYDTASSNDYTTIKYDANGNQLWVAKYNGPGNGSDQAAALVVDASGNVYATGASIGLGTAKDYATIKYDSNGNQLWVARFDGGDGTEDNSSALAVDNVGNVYVTGGAGFGPDRSSAYTTIKYDSSGNQLWVRRFKSGSGGSSVGNDLALDAAGNVYVTGAMQFGQFIPYSGPATVKYDTNGNQVWAAFADSAFIGSGRGVAVDKNENAYITGSVYDSSSANDIFVAKYDVNGSRLWVTRYNGPGNWEDVASDIVTDTAGNVYVTGGSYGESATLWDYATIKYDTSGNQLWVARFNGVGSLGYNDVATDLTLDTAGNVYVTGSSRSGTPDDYGTVKYDSDGNELWRVRYNGPSSGADLATGLAIDRARNVYVTGYGIGSGTNYDYATIKYIQYPIPPPRTGQTTCYDTAGTLIPCAGTGQDGAIQAGVPWPSPRFTDNSDGTITDNLTGLIWTKDANLMASRDPNYDTDGTIGDGVVKWQRALDYIIKLNSEAYLGHTDWRLPNVNELESVIDAQRTSADIAAYWSSSTYPNGNFAWVVGIYSGFVAANDKSIQNSGYVWPVRSGSGGTIQLAKTGQKICYDMAGTVIPCVGTGQDGEIQAGVPWPTPRFTDYGDGTVTDNLTGLIWTKDANLPATTKTWQEALDYVAAMNTGAQPNLGHTDWRLPNRKELQSLIDRGDNSPALPAGHPFTNVQSVPYWSSTSDAYRSVSAWIIYMDTGVIYAYDKVTFYGYGYYNVWPVRGGQVGQAQTPAPPIVSSIVPNSGPTGTSVTITGSNFGSTQGTSTVTFNGIIATVTSWSYTQIIATVPGGATTGPVVVTVNAIASNADQIFTVLLPDFTLSVIPDTQTIFQGGSASYTISLQGVNGFDSPVSLTVADGVPAGATTLFGPALVTPPDSADLTVLTDVITPTGTYTFAIQGSGGGQTHIVKVTLIVKENKLAATVILDPVPELLRGPSVESDKDKLATRGRIVQGVAADGVAQIVLRIPATFNGENLTLTVLDELTGQASTGIDEYGALGFSGSHVEEIIQSSIPIQAKDTLSGPMAFAVYRAPADFPRNSVDDSGRAARTVFVKIESQIGASYKVPIDILRPPVILIHGIWGSPSRTWDEFKPFVDDSRFSLFRVDYDERILINGSNPDYPSAPIANKNQLGFAYNSVHVLDQIRTFINLFKHSQNLAAIDLAAIQADLVTSSMGGDIARTLPKRRVFSAYDTFEQGVIHKLITIGTPHLGTPLAIRLLEDNNTCVRERLAIPGLISFISVDLLSGGRVNGGVFDLQGDVAIGGDYLSNAIRDIHIGNLHKIPTAMISGVMSQEQLNNLNNPFSFTPRFLIVRCPLDPLAQNLTPERWPAIVGTASDAIVPLVSQEDGLLSSRATAIHPGAHVLGFGRPEELEEASGISIAVIDLLNKPVTSSYFIKLPQ